MEKRIKHKHGTPNPIILQEEKAILLAVDRALASTSNSATVGRNGEIPLLQFLNRYLPQTLRAVSGHFVPPSGILSPQIDVLILDSRYPLLAENADGTVLAMLHSVICAIEVKTRLTTRDIKLAWKNSNKILELASEVENYGNVENWKAIWTDVVAYRCAQRLDTLENKYIEVGEPQKGGLDIYILRFQEKDQPSSIEIGGEFHFEPPSDDEEANESEMVQGFWPTCRASFTPLSDFYYHLIQNAYYTLGTRDYSFDQIGEHFLHYMSWSTGSWDDLYSEKLKNPPL
ncbi:MAG: hypothetical protein KDC83_15370 [Flavobacteriales bacterium]|nr:hypothetical protein [Flavobacteriales bacterium]MCB8976228.1 hypothetical protein [Ardenticatenaceae bacterium]